MLLNKIVSSNLGSTINNLLCGLVCVSVCVFVAVNEMLAGWSRSVPISSALTPLCSKRAIDFYQTARRQSVSGCASM